MVDGNFAVRSQGEGGRLALGTEGGGFWFKGPNNYVRNNVAADLWGNTTEAAYGFKFFLYYLGNIRVPNFKGADTRRRGNTRWSTATSCPCWSSRTTRCIARRRG